MDDVIFRGTETNVSSWQRGFWSTYTEVWSPSRIGCWTSNFRLLHGWPTGSSGVSFEIKYHLYADDSQLLDKTTLQDLDACRLRIEGCVESIREWCFVQHWFYFISCFNLLYCHILRVKNNSKFSTCLILCYSHIALTNILQTRMHV